MKKLGVLLLFLTMGLAGFSLENDPKSAIDSVEYQEWNSDTTWWFINYHYWSAKDITGIRWCTVSNVRGLMW